MAKARTIAIGILGALAVIAVAAAWALHAFTDPEALAQQARARVRAQTGRELRIGDISLDFFPRPAIVATDVALANPRWAKERDLLSVRRVWAPISLVALLARRLRVERLDIEGARLDLEEGAKGERNWAFDSSPHGDGGPPQRDWSALEAIRIEDSEIVYRAGSVERAPWHVASARLDARPGMREATIDAQLLRDGTTFHAHGRFADLSHVGEPSAACDGEVWLDWPTTHLVARGLLPLNRMGEGARFEAKASGDSLEDVLALFDAKKRHTAPFSARTEVSVAKGEVVLRALDLALGKQRMKGELRFAAERSSRSITGSLESDALDWKQALLDAGIPLAPPLPPGEVFSRRPLPWRVLSALAESRGAVDVRLGALRLPDGIELQDAKTQVTLGGGEIVLDPFSAHALGGSASARLRLQPATHAVHADFDGDGLLLERWFHERHRPIPFTGGPMKVHAAIAMTGESFKQLAASVNGPVTIAMGPGTYESKRAGDWEEVMVRFSKADSKGRIDFECASAALPFVAGRAQGKDIVGGRTAQSALLTSGTVDMRAETVDLRGRIHPKPGEGVGLSTIADDLEITGPLRKMRMALDPAKKPKAIARAAGAVATLGLSLLAKASHNSNRDYRDACDTVFNK